MCATVCCKCTSSGTKGSQSTQTPSNQLDNLLRDAEWWAAIRNSGGNQPSQNSNDNALEREWGAYGRLIHGTYDRLISEHVRSDRNMDDKLSSDQLRISGATGNKDTAKHPPCETMMVTFLTETVNKHAFAALFNNQPGAVEQLRNPGWQKKWNTVFNAPSKATQSDLTFVFRVFFNVVDGSFASRFGGNYKNEDTLLAVTLMSRTFNNLPGTALCHAKFQVAAGNWWQRHRAELEQQWETSETRRIRLAEMPERCRKSLADPVECDRIPALSDREQLECRLDCQNEARKVVYNDCSDTFGVAITKCDDIGGFTEGDREVCREQCKEKALDAFQGWFETFNCGAYETGPKLKDCDWKKPVGSTIPDNVVSKRISECKRACPIHHRIWMAARATAKREEEARAREQASVGYITLGDLFRGAASPPESRSTCVSKCHSSCGCGQTLFTGALCTKSDGPAKMACFGACSAQCPPY